MKHGYVQERSYEYYQGETEVLDKKEKNKEQLPVSAYFGIVALGKAHMCFAPSSSLSSLSWVTMYTVPMQVWMQTVHDLGGWNISHLLSPPLFPLGNECCGLSVQKAPQVSGHFYPAKL